MKRAVLTIGWLIAFSPLALAQSNLLGGSIPLSPLTSGGGIPVSDAATEANTYIIARSVITGGVAGGFDPTMALAPDLQQQVSSAGGLALDNAAVSTQYPTLWPGYGNASYNQNPPPGSPEGDMATTLGTLQGTLQAGADQQNSQGDELARLEALEAENSVAAGILQVLEISNDIALFVGEQDMKLRNASNAQLNALVVAESNRQNKEAQNELLSMAVGASVQYDWDLPQQPQEPIMPDPGLAE
jgi:hypothetical protein